MSVIETAKLAKKATTLLLATTESERVRALKSIAITLKNHQDQILKANAQDLLEAVALNLSNAMTDRLSLSAKSIQALSEMCLSVAAQPQVVGSIEEQKTQPNGLIIQKQRIPIGVIGMIFESRPNVVVDGAALAIKSGNAIILKGGKEAHHTNRAMFDLIHGAIKDILPPGTVSLIETREDVAELLKLSEYIDLMVPRGGSALINYVKANATMPVISHDKGLCHMYVHLDADTHKTIPIVLNSKVQRPGVCNALESLLLHVMYPENKKVIDELIKAGVEVRGCSRSQALNPAVKSASVADYGTEYLDKITSLKIVDNENEAIAHIQSFSSHHTEAILAQDKEVIEKFLNSLDASALIVNSSTRFNDGGELGLGAELGISTSKLHAYGPMGAKEMTTTRFLVRGNGQIR